MSSFDPNIPNPNDLLSNSQPVLKTNNQALDNVFGKNHFKFSLSDGTQGKHQFCEMVAVSGSSAPAGLATGEGTLFTQGSTPQLLYTPGNTGDKYQLTTCSHANYASFSGVGNYGSPPAAYLWQGGWTFLPGGFILQYGTVTQAGTIFDLGTTLTASVTFPRSFPSACFGVTQTLFYTGSTVPSDSNSITAKITSTSDFEFTFHSSATGFPAHTHIAGFFWWALGY